MDFLYIFEMDFEKKTFSHSSKIKKVFWVITIIRWKEKVFLSEIFIREQKKSVI